MSDSSSDEEAYSTNRPNHSKRKVSEHRQLKRSHDRDSISPKTDNKNDTLTESNERYERNDDEFISRRELKKRNKSSELGSSMPPIPPPPKISKIQIGKPNKPGITMKLMTPKTKAEGIKKLTVANAFRNDSDDEDEVEEMPPECRMRMRNIGRDTPTSSGPNSFGKTKQGFIDSKKIFEKSLKEATVD